MDELRKFASAHYDKAPLKERKKVMEFFDKLDSNGDGGISLEDYKKGVPHWFSDDDRIFRQLDANGDGKLDFSDVVVLYYMGNNTEMHKCDICRKLLAGLYFTCVPCYRIGKTTFDLCSDCYAQQGNKFQHPHSLSNFADQNALLGSIRGNKKEMVEEAVRWTDQGQYQLVVAEPRKVVQPTSSFDAHQREQENREMKELSEIAQAHYRAAPQNVQALANNFFQSMDADGDGHIDLPEFLSFMREQGYPNMRNPHFFKALDRDGNGTLEFSEVLTLYYIVKSGRPFCDMCGNFIPGTFFSCVDCYKRRESSMYLCRDCYCSGKCKHNHNGRAQFLDNYTRDEAQQQHLVNPNTKPTSTQTRSPVTPISDATAPKTQITNVYHHYPQNNYYNTTHHVINPPHPCQAVAIIPAGSNKKSWTVALKAFEVGMSIGSVASTLCSIL